MADDIFAAVAQGLAALEKTAQAMTRTTMGISAKTAEFRSGLRDAERTKELLEQIEKRHKELKETHRGLSSYLEKL